MNREGGRMAAGKCFGHGTDHYVHGSFGHDGSEASSIPQQLAAEGGVGVEQREVPLVVLRRNFGEDVWDSTLNQSGRPQELHRKIGQTPNHLGGMAHYSYLTPSHSSLPLPLPLPSPP